MWNRKTPLLSLWIVDYWKIVAAPQNERYRDYARLVVFGVILFLGIQAQAFWAAQRSTSGFVCLGVAAALLSIITLPLPPARIAGVNLDETPTLPLTRSRWRRIFGFTWTAGGMLLLWSAWDLMLGVRSPATPDPFHWDQFVIGLVVFCAGLWTLTGVKYKHSLPPLQTVGLFLVPLVIGLLFRLYHFSTQPPGIWFDEAINGLLARRMLHEREFLPLFSDNMTTLHLWLYKMALSVGGETNIEALRLISVAFGLGTVMMAFVVGHQLHGAVFGFLMAFFLAIMRWSVNFSRVAMTGIEVGFFTLLTFYFFNRFVREGRLRDAFYLGLAAGGGLWFYSAFRVHLIVFVLYGLSSLRFWRIRRIRGGLVALLTTLVVASPVLIFWRNNEDLFLTRTRQVSIFEAQNRLHPDLEEALEFNVRAHLKMFHVRGDLNGRHNLPAEPMLDPVMGSLLILGMGLGIRRIKMPETRFFSLIAIASLMGGILTLDFEAPQALRTIGILPALAYFCALATWSMAYTGYHVLRRNDIFKPAQARQAMTIPLVLLLTASTLHNATTYFIEQRESYDVWENFSSVETELGEIVRRQDEMTALYMSPVIAYHPSTDFVAPDFVQRQNTLQLPDALPLRISPQPVALFLHFNDRWLWEYAQALYPNGRFIAVRAEDFGIQGRSPEALFYVIELSAEDVASVQGLDLNGRGVLYAPTSGIYTFQVPSGGILGIDGHIFGAGDTRFYLAQGNHVIHKTPPALAIRWQTPLKNPQYHPPEPIPDWQFFHEPVAMAGLLGCFYANEDWRGNPVLQRIDSALDTYFHFLPLRRPYSVIWQGGLKISHADEYRFNVRAVTYAEVWLDGKRILETVMPNEDAVSPPLYLEEGVYPLEIRYRDLSDYSRIHLQWEYPGLVGFLTIPPQNLVPPHLMANPPVESPDQYCPTGE